MPNKVLHLTAVLGGSIGQVILALANLRSGGGENGVDSILRFF